MDFFPFINGKIGVFLEPVNVLFGHVASHVVKNENLRLRPHDSVYKRTQTSDHIYLFSCKHYDEACTCVFIHLRWGIPVWRGNPIRNLACPYSL